METKSRLVVRRQEMGEMESDYLMGKAFLSGDENVLKLDIVDGCATL